jgi:ubiquinone biosynthesis protein UbiJ
LSKKKFRKSVDSIRRQIEIHYEKIANEQRTLVPDENLIIHWQKEILGLQKSLDRAEKRLRRGK